MPIVEYFDYDPGTGSTNLPNSGTFDFPDLSGVSTHTIDVTDSDDQVSEVGESATGTGTLPDGTELVDADVSVSIVWTVTYQLPGEPLQTIKIGEFRIDGDDDYLIVTGPLPPAGTTMTIVSRDTSPSVAEGTSMGYADIVTCFTAGTQIRTATGNVAVETLNVGDLVETKDHGLQPVRWVGKRKVAAKGAFAPVVIEAGALGNARAMEVSPCHRMLISDWRAEAMFGTSEVLIAAKDLAQRDDIYTREGGDVEYVHVLFDNHEIIFAEEAPTESFNPSVTALDTLEEGARDEVYALFPELKAADETQTARRVLKPTEAQALLN